MNAKIIFRSLLIIQAAFVLVIALLPDLHLDIQEFIRDLGTMMAWKEKGLYLSEKTRMVLNIAAILMVIAMISFICGLIGSFFYMKWGRVMLVATAIISLVSENVIKPIGVFPTHSMCHEATAAVFYIALTMSFLPPVRDCFEAKDKHARKDFTS
jgi:hypothetical protein